MASAQQQQQQRKRASRGSTQYGLLNVFSRSHGLALLFWPLWSSAILYNEYTDNRIERDREDEEDVRGSLLLYFSSTTAAAAAGLLGVFVVGNLASTAAAASASDLIISFLQPH